ncbi:topology modulation protein [Nonomuraea wenchangensis]
MNRVAVVGSGGSGKSYVARELGCLLGAPVTHLDAVYYDDEWNPLPPEKFEAVQRKLVAASRWVIDGNYNSSLHVRLEACDTVVMMDVPTRIALWGIFSRQLRHGAGQYTSGVYNRIHWGVITYVATYRRRMRPKVLAKIDELAAGKPVVFLTSRAETRRWLEQVAASRCPAVGQGS